MAKKSDKLIPPDAKATDKPADKPKAGDAETSTRSGISLLARGDLTGALQALHAAIQANPNYAPAWRGLGIVYEKQGDRGQARAAFKRYLQLAPSAGDADQIRDRLERLGT